jgi:hypothetical protein
MTAFRAIPVGCNILTLCPLAMAVGTFYEEGVWLNSMVLAKTDPKRRIKFVACVKSVCGRRAILYSLVSSTFTPNVSSKQKILVPQKAK